MSRAKIIDHYILEAQNPGFEIDTIIRELSEKNVDHEEIQIIVRVVDNEIQRNVLIKTANDKSKELILVGLVLAVIGGGITIGTYTGLINLGNTFLLAYGPFFAGVSIMLTGLAKKKY